MTVESFGRASRAAHIRVALRTDIADAHHVGGAEWDARKTGHAARILFLRCFRSWSVMWRIVALRATEHTSRTAKSCAGVDRHVNRDIQDRVVRSLSPA
jgi:hypothetical protein